MKYICVPIVVILIACLGLATADVLPQPVPENQMFATISIIEAAGIVDESTSLVWRVSDARLDSLPLPYFKDDKMVLPKIGVHDISPLYVA
jgi:hypothetical protein